MPGHVVLVAPTTHTSVVVRHIPDSKTRAQANELTVVDLPALGRPAKQAVSIALMLRAA